MKTRGFTLIEVLIASLILFVVISSATIVFNGAVKSKQNATSAITNYAYVPILMEHVAVQIRRESSSEVNEIQGKGHLFGADYRWQATIEREAPIKTGPTGESAAALQGQRAILWGVAVTVLYNNREQDYIFNVTSWMS